MTKQVVIQLQDFNKDTSDVPLPDELVSVEEEKTASLTVIEVSNHLNIDDFKLTNEIARQAFINYIASKNGCCLNKSYSKKLRVLRIEYSFIYLYTLETFTEKRQTCFNYSLDCESDEQTTKEIPPIWSIRSDYDPIPFVDHYELSVVPNSEVIKFCNKCNATQKRTCPDCLGIQREKTCVTCDGTHSIPCEICENGKLKWFQSLKIIWKNHIDKFYSKSSIPENELVNISGTLIYEANGSKINPINFVDDVEVTKASEKLIKLQEETSLQREKLIEQRHELRAIKLALVHYQYGKQKLGKYWLFYDKIEDLNVFSVDYSKNCCVGCFIC